MRARFDRWRHGEPAIDPRRFVRFHPEQPTPYETLDDTSDLDWVACRVLGEGTPCWVPADLVFLDMRPGTAPRFGPSISTGWSAHATAQQALAGAIFEAIERDAIVGAWWGSYPLVELDPPELDVMERLARENLRYRWYRVVTPRAAHVTIVTVDGEDREGRVFSIGSACRLDREASLRKSALEAVQGRHYVRYLLSTTTDVPEPTSFAEHAAYYSRHPRRLADTCLEHADRVADDAEPETLAQLVARLPQTAFRHMTPPALVDRGYTVMRVVVPELQPLHGDHRLPFLGGPLWNRPLTAWATMPPHPFA
jgi:ribosomal protein S12 methylthiotransferase accessory factor